MSPALAFSTGNTLALLCWLALALSLFVAPMRAWTWRTTSLIVPALLAIAYVVLIVAGWGRTPDGGFGSIGQVRALFADDAALTAGWLHYLAFDLFVGTWIARTGLSEAVHPLLLVPCLALAFLFGPAGLLLFLALRLVLARKGDVQ